MPKIKINDINIYYEIHGDPTKPTLVFVSGFTSDHTCWAKVVDRYLSDYQVVIFDNRGIGQTDAPEKAYSTAVMADDTIGLLRALKINKAHFVGHSFGGAIVQTIAYKYPERVHSIVLVSSTPTKINERAKQYADVRLEFMESGLVANKVVQKAIVRFITLTCWSREYLSKPAMADSLVQQGFYPISMSGYRGQKSAIETFDSSGWIDKIACRCLIITGDDDVFIDHNEWQKLCAKMRNATFYCIRNVGHMSFVEKPDEFHREFALFLKKQPLEVRDVGLFSTHTCEPEKHVVNARL